MRYNTANFGQTFIWWNIGLTNVKFFFTSCVLNTSKKKTDANLLDVKPIISYTEGKLVKYHKLLNSKKLVKQYSTNCSNKKTDFKTSLPSNIKLAPWWVSGIIDSEGNFSILVQNTNNGPKITLAFKVTQKEHSLGILLDLQKYFDCGNIYIDNRKENAYKFSVNRIGDIVNKVIPHLDKYPLFTSKNLDYLDFKKVALLMKDKLHLNKEVMYGILLLKSKMNSLRSFEERWNYLKNFEDIKLNNEWVQAFVDGEGSFQFGIANAMSRGKPYIALTPTLEIAQSNHDVGILNAFVQFFGCGYLKPKYDINDIDAAKSSRIVNRFVIHQHSVVTEFFDKYPLLTRKHLDYLDWKKLIQLKAERAQDTPEGLQKMKDIKASMNKGRS